MPTSKPTSAQGDGSIGKRERVADESGGRVNDARTAGIVPVASGRALGRDYGR